MSRQRRAIIIGAGPAGLTAAYELLTRSDVHPIVLEKSSYMGGISRTVQYKGNRIDIGGHRFFSKSDRVMNWWLSHLPMESHPGANNVITYHNQSRTLNGLHGRPGNGNGNRLEERVSSSADKVMLVRNRKSRIYFLRRFFEYPISLSPATLRNLGLWRTFRIGVSYLRRAIFPLKQVINLEQFFINRFGEELYRTFFKSYTEKVWGVPCEEIDAAWGEQRIKKLSIGKTILHAVQKMFKRSGDVAQKETETSLIERFLYPKFGPGQMWEEVAHKVTALGGEIHTDVSAEKLVTDGRTLQAVVCRDKNGQAREFHGDFFFSTMPIKELVRSLDCEVPDEIRAISDGLQYRDFITVGLLLDELKIKEESANGDGKRLIADNWIYIQEPEVLAGRLQIFNNWSPGMVADPNKIWVGVEYFCNEGDELWNRSDQELGELAREELDRISIIERSKVLDSTVLRMPKSYPAYFGTYQQFPQLQAYIDTFENLFLLGRNGMHKYNNQDHSMLTAMTAVDNIVEGRVDKANIWAVNTEMEYHETTSEERERTATEGSRVPLGRTA
ncbi:MAG TPA: NAD(P)/FAD-dependent oxidoreductase [Terriglobales bacterium]|nr:NAD(P)/FAD-dependent oxidoreductase [Terriglobales bacterium]